MLRRLAVITVAVAGGMVLAGPASAKAPVLLTVGHVSGHPTATWSLPSGVEAAVAEVATSPATGSDGYFFFENVRAFDTLQPSQTSWTYTFQLDPGTYYVHIAGIDRPCFFANQCPVREFSQIMILVIGSGGGGGTPPPPGTETKYTLSVTTTGTGAGTVTSDPAGINCGTDCSEAYAVGGHVMLTATPQPGSVFGGWTNSCGQNPRCEVIMNYSGSVTARFDRAAVAAPASTPPARTQPDFSLVPASRSVRVPSGGSASLSVAVQRTVALASDVILRTEDLPAGVRVRSFPGGYTRELTFRVPRSIFPGEYVFSLVGQAGNLVKSVEMTLVVTEPERSPATGSTSRRTWRSAATLPSRAVFTGDRSIKHSLLTSLVYRTMKAVAKPRTLAIACWADGDYEAVADSAGIGPVRENGMETSGFWLGRQPRWLHLAPWVCTGVQEFLTTRRGNGRNALSLRTALHEAIHAYGVDNEAQTNCYAVQLVPSLARHAGATPAHATYLGKLALNGTRARAPDGYWNASMCRDGGRWDLRPSTPGLG